MGEFSNNKNRLGNRSINNNVLQTFKSQCKEKKTYWLNKNKTFDLEQELAKFRACKGLTQCIELKFLNIIMA
jgi:hypothetical protein